MWHLLRKIFGSADVIPTDVRQLPATSKEALSSSLQYLPLGERGWIRLTEAAHLFSPEEPDYAFGDMDDEGKRRLTEFGADCRCEFQFMPTEGRVYFRRRW